MAQQKVKVCGMREAENIREVEALGVDLMGFIFWPKSSRYVSERPDYMPTKCKRVGVFVDENIAQVKAIANEYSLDYIQLHGKENTDYVKTLEGYHLIKAFNIATPEDFKACQAYEGLVDFFLFDTKGKSVGGNGEKFDWSVLSAYQGDTPFLLSGGISPDDAASVRAIHHPKFAGVDLGCRRVIKQEMKNVEQLRKFIKGL